jgi:hypothetical protein
MEKYVSIFEHNLLAEFWPKATGRVNIPVTHDGITFNVTMLTGHKSGEMWLQLPDQQPQDALILSEIYAKALDIWQNKLEQQASDLIIPCAHLINEVTLGLACYFELEIDDPIQERRINAVYQLFRGGLHLQSEVISRLAAGDNSALIDLIILCKYLCAQLQINFPDRYLS